MGKIDPEIMKRVNEKVEREMEEFESTLGSDLDIEPDFVYNSDESISKNETIPSHVFVKITASDGKTVRYRIPIPDLFERARKWNDAVRQSNYPRWLDDKASHVTSRADIIRVEKVLYNVESNEQLAVVSVFNRDMKKIGRRAVEINGDTDKKALARKTYLAPEYSASVVKGPWVVLWEARK